MSEGLPPDDIRSMWLSQPTEPLQRSPAELRREAQRFTTLIRRRNIRELIACLFVAAAFGWSAWTSHSLVSRVGHCLIVAAASYVAFRVMTTGASRRPPPDATVVACVAFHRRELERQRDLLLTVSRWYIGPFIPGLFVLLADRVFHAVVRGEGSLVRAVLSAGSLVVLLWVIDGLNRAGARKLDAEIARLDAADEPAG